MTAPPTRDVIANACATCGLPVYADQGYYSITKEHWDCHQASILTPKELSISPLGRRGKCREGEGKVARRAKKLAIVALEEALGGPLDEVTLWNQQGSYRGPKWDLDAWGLDFTFTRNGHPCKGSASSLGTMTACVRDCAHGGRMVAEAAGDLAYTYDLSARKSSHPR